MVRKARKHRYSFLDNWEPPMAKKASKGLSAVASDVALALKQQGFSSGDAKRLARSARGSDFESRFRDALSRRGNPTQKRTQMSKKKKSKKKNSRSRKGKMPAGLAAYWAKKRARKANSRKRRTSAKRTAGRVRIVINNPPRKRRKARRTRKVNSPRARKLLTFPIRVSRSQAKKVSAWWKRNTGGTVRMK